MVKEAIKAKGGPVKILRKGHRWLPPKKFRARHRKLARIRARIENFRDLETQLSFSCHAIGWACKARCQIHLAVIAYNFKR